MLCDTGREGGSAVSSFNADRKLSNRKPRGTSRQAPAIAVRTTSATRRFVLWKRSASDEHRLGRRFSTDGADQHTIHGRPGWSHRMLGDERILISARPSTFMRGAGISFPAHENEIAQSCCAHGNAGWALPLMHNGFLPGRRQKMSKSDGNFVTIAELLTEKFVGGRWPWRCSTSCSTPDALWEPFDFTLSSLQECRKTCERFFSAVALPAGRLVMIWMLAGLIEAYPKS